MLRLGSGQEGQLGTGLLGGSVREHGEQFVDRYTEVGGYAARKIQAGSGLSRKDAAHMGEINTQGPGDF